jgi:hypothetical protein
MAGSFGLLDGCFCFLSGKSKKSGVLKDHGTTRGPATPD